jgi:hypothetical protein
LTTRLYPKALQQNIIIAGIEGDGTAVDQHEHGRDGAAWSVVTIHLQKLINASDGAWTSRQSQHLRYVSSGIQHGIHELLLIAWQV